jgi:hypothetical protein
MSSSAEETDATAAGPAIPAPAGPGTAEAGAEPAALDRWPAGWAEFAERPAPVGLEVAAPADELAAALQRYWSGVEEERGRAGARLETERESAVEMAVRSAALGRTVDEAAEYLTGVGDVRLGRRLDSGLRHLRRAIADAGIEVHDPLGEPYESVADHVGVMDWVYRDEYTAETVIQTIEPIVRDRGEVVREGLVVVGAPPAEPAPVPPAG